MGLSHRGIFVLFRLLVLDDLPAPAAEVAISNARRYPELRHALSAWKEAALFRHVGSEFSRSTDLERKSGDAEDDEAGDRGILLPVGRLTVPAARGRPAVLGVATIVRRAA